MSERVLVTGGAGFIGSHTCKALAAEGLVPVAFDDLSRGHAEFVRWGPLVQGDILDPAALAAAFTRHRPAAVIHFAALAYVGESVEQPLAYVSAEIVIVDNGSTDDTSAVIRQWAARQHEIQIQMLSEPIKGKSRGLNKALCHAKGELLAFTDDDCRLDVDYVRDLIRHYAADTELVIRGGRVELGDPSDLPITIYTGATRKRWSNAAPTPEWFSSLAGCNLTMRRAVWMQIGAFDENLGPGSLLGSGDDFDLLLRAYFEGIALEYVPDMIVRHHHGRKLPAEGRALYRCYFISRGGLIAKHLTRYPRFLWQVCGALVRSARELLTGKSAFAPELGFSCREQLECEARGIWRYIRRNQRARTQLRAGQLILDAASAPRGDNI